jgi:hypothetical protein
MLWLVISWSEQSIGREGLVSLWIFMMKIGMGIVEVLFSFVFGLFVCVLRASKYHFAIDALSIE